MSPQPLLMPKFIEDGWEVHYIAIKTRNRTRNPSSQGLNVTFHLLRLGSCVAISWQNMLDAPKAAVETVQSLFIMLRLGVHRLFF